MILPNILKTIWRIDVIFEDINNYLIEYLGQWPLFYGPVIFFYIFQIIWWKNVILVWHNDWPKNIYIYICRSVTHISQSTDFV